MAALSQFDLIWADACARYHELIEVSPVSSSFPHPSSLDELEALVEQRNGDFKAFRENRKSLFRVLSAICKPIEALGKVVSDIAAEAFPPSVVCYGAISYLIQAARNVSDSYDAIISLFERLQDCMVRLRIYSEVEITSALRDKLAEILSVLLQVLAHATKLVKHRNWGRIEQLAKRLVLGKDPELATLLSRLDQLTSAEHHVASAEIYVEVRKMATEMTKARPDLRELSTKLDAGNKRIEGIESTLHAMQRESLNPDDQAKDAQGLKAILQPSVYPADIYDLIQNARANGTGGWIQNEPAFQEWLHQTSPVLWVSGPPGSGKSFLCSHLISLLIENNSGIDNLSSTDVAFFFFRDSAPLTRSLIQALNDMAYQLTQLDPRYAKHLASTIASRSDIPSLQSQWRKLFREYFVTGKRETRRAILILDGIDESDLKERKEFFEMLSDLQTDSSRLQIVLFGRPQILDEIRETFDAPLPTVHVDENNNSDDINTYIHSKIKGRGLKPQTREAIVEILKEKAEGMFMWVNLMVREVLSSKHESRIFETLQHAPRGLDKMLQHVLDTVRSNLNLDSVNDLDILLKWIAFSVRPLSLAEVEDILRLETNEQGGIVNLERQLRTDFASFFLLHREDGLTTGDLHNKPRRPSAPVVPELEDYLDDQDLICDSNVETTVLVFRHASIGDFFRTKHSVPVNDSAGTANSPSKMAASVLIHCLRLICDESASPRLRIYAGGHWYAHFQRVSQAYEELDLSQQQALGQLLVKMLRDEGTIGSFWIALLTHEFFTSEVLSCLTGWLQQEAVFSLLSSDDQVWITSWRGTPARALLHVGRVAAREWLCGVQWAPVQAMLIIRTILTLNEIHSAYDDLCSIESIISAAEWSKLEQNALWQRRLGVCLRDCKHLPAALEHFRMAIHLDERMWLARSGMARVYGMRKDYVQAIALELENESIIEQHLDTGSTRHVTDAEHATSKDLALLRFRIAGWYRAKHDFYEAYTYYSKAFAADPSDYVAFTDAMVMLHHHEPNLKVWDEHVIAAMKALDTTLPGSENTRLTELLWHFYGFDRMYFTELASAAKGLGQLDWLLERYEIVANLTERARSPVKTMHLEICLADLYRLSGDIAAAVRIWQRIASMTSRPAALENAEVERAKNRVALRYGSYCYQEALHTTQPTDFIKQLQNMCTKTAHNGRVIIVPNSAALFLTIWYRTRGNVAQYRRYARDLILHSLYLLFDDDPGNDMEGYRQLVSSLVAAGAELHAAAVARFIRPQRRTLSFYWGMRGESMAIDSPLSINPLSRTQTLDSVATSPESARLQRTNTLPLSDADANSPSIASLADRGNTQTSYATVKPTEDEVMRRARRLYPITDYRDAWCCQGACRRVFPLYHQLHICRICLTELCNECWDDLICGGEPTGSRCARDHEWLHIENPDWETQKAPVVDGREMNLLEFKELLLNEWS